MAFNKNINQFITKQAVKLRAIILCGGKCIQCGNNNIHVLEFHHTTGDDKKYAIGNIFAHKWANIYNEITKCVILCSNCHRELHFKSAGRDLKEKQRILTLINKYNCEECGYSGENIGSLSFHHYTGEKLFNIADYYSRHKCATICDLEDELSKCKLLCRNCHAMEHKNINLYNEYESVIIKRSKVIRNNSKKIDRQQVKNMLMSGMKQIDISKRLHCAKSTITGIVKEFIESNTE